MASARVRRGRRTQEVVADYLREWWPDAKAVAASLPGVDITGVDGVAPEVKARADFNPLLWQRQAQRNAKPGELPVVIMRPVGSGEKDVQDWPAFMPLHWLVALLRDAGYVERTYAPVDRR